MLNSCSVGSAWRVVSFDWQSCDVGCVALHCSCVESDSESDSPVTPGRRYDGRQETLPHWPQQLLCQQQRESTVEVAFSKLLRNSLSLFHCTVMISLLYVYMGFSLNGSLVSVEIEVLINSLHGSGCYSALAVTTSAMHVIVAHICPSVCLLATACKNYLIMRYLWKFYYRCIFGWGRFR